MNRQTLRIYARSSFGTGPSRPQRVVESLPRKRAAPIDHTAVIDGELARILDAAPEPGESVQRAFDRKEHELRVMIASLTHAETTAMHARLSSHRRDGVNASFLRLTRERRVRLLSFIAAPRMKLAGAL